MPPTAKNPVKRKKSSKRKRTLLSLPDEILELIVHLSGRYKTISTLNHRFRQIAIPFLYQRVSCKGFLGLPSLLQVGLSERAKYVQEISITYPEFSVKTPLMAAHLGVLFQELSNSTLHQTHSYDWLKITNTICMTLSAFNRCCYSKVQPNIKCKPSVVDLFVTCYKELIQLVTKAVLPGLSAFRKVEIKGNQRTGDEEEQVDLTNFICSILFRKNGPSSLSLNSLPAPTSNIVHLQHLSFHFPVYKRWDDVTQPGLLRAILILLRPTLKSLKIKLPQIWLVDAQQFILQLDRDETVGEWDNLESLHLVDSEIFDGRPWEDPSTHFHFPKLQTLYVNSSLILPYLMVGTDLKSVTCEMSLRCDQDVFEWLQNHQTAQSVTFLIEGWPQPEYLAMIFNSIPQVLSLNLRITGSDGRFETLSLAEALLGTKANHLHSTLQHLKIIDVDDSTVMKWFSTANALKRIFPSIQTFGYDIVDELFDSSRFSSGILMPRYSNGRESGTSFFCDG